jgi:hypothetical protein
MRPALLHALVVLAALCSSCSSDDSSLVRASLSLEASDASGRHAVLGCEQLPLLQGSHRYTRYVVDDVVTVSVMAVPSEIRLDFAEDDKPLHRSRTIQRGTLLREFAEEVDLLLYDGGIYTVTLSSGCSE